jgi:ferrochelatase
MDATVSQEAHRPPSHPAVKSGRIGVLIVNLGTPDATDFRSVRRYLKEFLSDKRVIETNSLVWKLIFNGVILTARPRIAGRNYDKIWDRERNESPLRTITRSQGEKLSSALAKIDSRIVVDWAMRYGTPSISSRVAALAEAGCERLLVIPLYPQYAAATSATVCDEVFRALMQLRWQPSVRVAPPYFEDDLYIQALASSVDVAFAALPFEPEVLIASYHGIPQEYFDKGDPYHCHCAKTTRLLREKLGWDEKRLIMTFQSRFGRAEWIKPYTDHTIRDLAQRGVKNIAVITPGFSADCLETLEEIAGENRELFKHNGGENYFAIPCLNDSELGMTVVTGLALNELKGWI